MGSTVVMGQQVQPELLGLLGLQVQSNPGQPDLIGESRSAIELNVVARC